MSEATGELLGQPLDLEALEQTALDFEAQAAKFTQKAHAVRQIITGYIALNGDATSVLTRKFSAHRTFFEMAPLDANGPRGPRAVLKVMREEPDRVWKVVEIKREMLRRGWAATPKAVEASVKKLRSDGRLIPTEYGHYKLAPEPEAQALIEEDAA